MRYFVYSTLSASVKYAFYAPSPSGGNELIRTILIKGGAGVAQLEGVGNIFTPLGVRTEVTQEEFDLLKENSTFMADLKSGHVVMDTCKLSAEKMAKDMPRDKSAPLQPADFTGAPRKKEIDGIRLTGLPTPVPVTSRARA